MDGRLIGFGIALILVAAAVVGILLGIGNSEPQPSLLTGTAAGKARTTAAAAAGGRVENRSIAINLTSGWSGKKTNYSLDLLSPSHAGELVLTSAGGYNGSDIELLQALLNKVAKAAAAYKLCFKPAAARLPNGPPGHRIGICYKLVPQAGAAGVFLELDYAAAAGGVGFVMQAITSATNGPQQKAFAGELHPVVPTIRWKLF
jgi:hypothetical protein